MGICQACGKEIMNGNVLCKSCSQQKRQMKYWFKFLKKLDKMMDDVLPYSEKEDKVVIAS